MKKRIFILSLLLLFLAQTGFADSKIDYSCFKSFASVNPKSTKTIKVKLFSKDTMLIKQDGDFLPFLFYKKEKPKSLDFNILEIKGFKKEIKKNSFLDGNLKTGLDYDVYYKGKPTILLNTKTILKKDKFHFSLFYDGFWDKQYFISKNGKNFEKVQDPNFFDWKFLKIIFVSLNEKSKNPLKLKEIILKENKGKSILLIKPKTQKRIEFFSDYDCQDKSKIIKKNIEIKKEKVNYKLDKNSQIEDIQWKNNLTYNNDFDNDKIINNIDNCRYVYNPDQKDTDNDTVGDKCDSKPTIKNPDQKDTDGDGVNDSDDNCINIFNPEQNDTNADGVGDLCSDDDNDGILGLYDNCINIYNPNQKDININEIGDACEFDKDKDGIFDSVDNCIVLKNPDQKDTDNDGIGDVCDNCLEYNPSQKDQNHNNIGDVCEEKEKFNKENDIDKDGILDYNDNCKDKYNPDQKDTDNDGIGDICDNCLKIRNHKQEDVDKNNVGDLCEDLDKDDFVGYLDNCPNIFNRDQKDTDNDGIGDVCEDEDFDAIPASKDNCKYKYNPNQKDTDNDGIGDVCDKKDDRFLESNKILFVGIMFLLISLFGGVIFWIFKKIKNKI